MKIGYICESPADQAAMAVFTETLLGEAPEPINRNLEIRGVSKLLGSLVWCFPRGSFRD